MTTQIIPYEADTQSLQCKVELSDKNKKELVFGGSGSGKTRFFIKPNLFPNWIKTKKGD
jgi:ATP-dependent phosphoenolpyruvate carboxykinase